MARLGYLSVAAAAVLWAFGGSYARTLIDRGASPLEITEARAWIAAVGIGLVVLARRRARPAGASRPGPRPHPGVFVALGLSIAAANYTYYRAIASLPVAIAIIVQYTAPALVVLWLAVVERASPSRRVLGALALTLAGVALLAELPRVVSTGELRLSVSGLLSAGGSALAFSSYILVGERIRTSVSAEDALFRGFLVASAFWIVVQATRGRPDTLLDGSFIPGVIVLGVFATIVPFMLFLWGLGHVGASRAGIVSTLEPLSAALLAYLWLGQSLGAGQIAGGLMVIAGIAVVQSEETAAAPTPAPLE
jgi:drug/metabolite transporter (DMT)-like permease